ncbi:MAG: hypothetical protein RID09_15330 [Coleofasciculus sp. G1-WW12-02]
MDCVPAPIELLHPHPQLRNVLVYSEGTGETGATLIDNVDLVC